MSETDLILESLGHPIFFPPFSARDCVQSLTPIPQENLRRTLNGELICLKNQGYRKFQSTITCKDKVPPAFEGLWIGTRLKVGCIQSLTHPVLPGNPYAQMERDAVTCHLHDLSGKEYPLKKSETLLVSIPSDFPGGFITYRPWLKMIVKNYHLETDEWNLSVEWKLDLEEE